VEDEEDGFGEKEEYGVAKKARDFQEMYGNEERGEAREDGAQGDGKK
jgi:hypothetical protein